jgi:hypothetical protein
LERSGSGNSDSRISGSLASQSRPQGRIQKQEHDEENRTEPLRKLQGESGSRALRGDKTLTAIAEQYQVHPTQVTEWKRQLTERAADVFDGAARNNENEPDLKVLHAKIGQQALETDFSGSALTEAGLLSARK